MNRARKIRFCAPLFFFRELQTTSSVRLTCARIQEQDTVAADFSEVEHLCDGIGDCVERALTDPLSAQPVIFHKPNDRTLISGRVVPAPGRHGLEEVDRFDEEGLPPRGSEQPAWPSRDACAFRKLTAGRFPAQFFEQLSLLITRVAGALDNSMA